VWTTLYDFFTKTVPPLAKPGSTVTVLTGRTPITGALPPAPSTSSSTGAFSVDFITQIEEKAKSDPRGLAQAFTGLYVAAGVTLGILSLIPTESNFGGPLAARMFHDLLRPIVDNVYTGPTDLYLRQFFPTRPINPRILVTAIEQGAIGENELIAALAEDGITDKGIQLTVRAARLLRFQSVTKDDFALARTYNGELIKEAIAALKDEEKAVIAQLKSTRADLVNQLGALA